jgi:uncharacterized repeat protein (TIGR03803 family)
MFYVVVQLAVLSTVGNIARAQATLPTNILYSFTGAGGVGVLPEGALLQSGSDFYGLTVYGGSDNDGTMFQFDPATNDVTLLHSFSGSTTDGENPYGSLIQSGSNLYGMTTLGGTYTTARGLPANFGVLFQYNLGTKTETLLYPFAGSPNDGSKPYGSLIQSGSVLYGLTSTGGTGSLGALIQYNVTTGKESVLHDFAGGTSDGATPFGSLLQSGSILYGMTNAGGAGGDGAIFDYDLATNIESMIYSFGGGTADGAGPAGSLIRSGSNLYGMTSAGGAQGLGTIFQYNLLTGDETLLYSFQGGAADGADPIGSLILSGSTLYGLTNEGGAPSGAGLGTVFDYDLTTGTENVLHYFTGSPTDGAFPRGDLTLSGSTLYGMTAEGGTDDAGVIFSITVPEPAPVSLLAFSGVALVCRPRRKTQMGRKFASTSTFPPPPLIGDRTLFSQTHPAPSISARTFSTTESTSSSGTTPLRKIVRSAS